MRMMTGGGASAGLRVLSIALGVFLFLMGSDKIAWLTDSSILVRQLDEWRQLTTGASAWYLDAVARPGAPLFARVVPIAEMAAGVALGAGLQVRLAAALALAMVVNFHFASGLIFTAGYLTNGYGPPVIGGLAALALGGQGLPWSMRR